MEGLAEALGISVLALDALIILLMGQLLLQFYALLDLSRRGAPTRSARFWALVIILGGLVGTMVYLIRASGDDRGRGPRREVGDVIQHRQQTQTSGNGDV